MSVGSSSSSMGGLDIFGYSLPSAKDFADLTSEYRSEGFSENVRTRHLFRLPTVVVPRCRLHLCPGCGDYFDQRSLQIDHIIPVRVICRHRMLQTKHDATAPFNDIRFEIALIRANGERNNLELRCVKCNSGKSDNFPTIDDLARELRTIKRAVRAEGDASDLAIAQAELLKSRLLQTAITLNEITGLTDKKQKFVLDGGVRSLPFPTRYGPSLTVPGTIDDDFRAIERLIVDMLAVGRPAWDVDLFLWLLQRQPSKDVDQFIGRPCFYCLGVFGIQSFQIDHIHPTVGRPASDYNQPGNLIPVCRTCNTSKGDRRLTIEWLDEQIVKRKRAGLPGAESVHDEAKLIAKRNHLLFETPFSIQWQSDTSSTIPVAPVFVFGAHSSGPLTPSPPPRSRVRAGLRGNRKGKQ